MRLYVSDSKNNMILFIYDYLREKLNNAKAKVIVNGRERVGHLTAFEIDEFNFEWIKFSVDDDEESITIPFNDSSKIRLDKGLYFFETESHTTLVYPDF